MTTISLQQVWKPLLESDKERIGWESLEWQNYDEFTVRAAVKLPEQKESILVGYPKGIELTSSVLPKGKGFSVFTVENGPDPNFSWLALCKEKKADIDIFTKMSMDVQKTLKVVKGSPAKRLKAFFERILLWQGFMEHPREARLSVSAQVGLIGELWFFQDLLNIGFDDGELLEFWKGPLGAPKDFKIGTTQIEVKTSVSPKNNQIIVSSLDQLDRLATEKLFLVTYLVCEDEKGVTLSEAVKATREMLSEINLDWFDSLVSMITGSKLLSDYDARFLRMEEKIFLVDDGFPAIVRSEIPPDIKEARYLLDISNLSKYAASMKELVETCGIKENEFE